MKILHAGLFILFVTKIHAQTISTFAGSGSSSYSGDGGPATACGITDPVGGTFDKSENYYFADGLGSNRIRKVDTFGIITTVAGNGDGAFGGDGGPAAMAQLYFPQSVKLDDLGNIFIGDAGNNRIRKVSVSTGIITTIAGTGIGAYGGDGGPATNALIFNPLDVCFDNIGNLYIADNSNNRIRKIDTSGFISTVVGTGTPASSGDGGAATAAQINDPSGVFVDANGNLYVAEWTGNRVRKINRMGIIYTVAGNGLSTYTGDGIAATNAQICPTKIAINRLGELYIADDFHRMVFYVDNGGILHRVAGDGISGYSGDGGPATNAEFNYPSGVSFDQCDNLYIPDVNNRRIRLVTFNPPPCNYLSVDNINEEKPLTVYPNPTYENLKISYLKSQSTYKLQSLVGGIVQQGTLHEGDNSIDIHAIANGMYLLEITDEEGRKTIRKIVKQ